MRWRGAVASAIRGQWGQKFLREMLAALDALPEKRLIAGKLDDGGEVCALGAVAQARGTPCEVDVHDHKGLSRFFGIAPAMVQEIEAVNDDDFGWCAETPEERFRRVREWVEGQIIISGLRGES